MNNNRYKKITCFLVVLYCVLLFIVLNLIYTFPQLVYAYKAPNVYVHFSNPVFVLSETDIDSVVFKEIDGAYPDIRGDYYLYFTRMYSVTVEESVIQENADDGQHILTKDELTQLLSDLCADRVQQSDIVFDMEDFSTIIDDDWQSSYTLGVSGRYSGYLVINNEHLKVNIDDTDINQAWKITDHIPYLTIAKCLVASIIITSLVILGGYVISRKTGDYMPMIIIVSLTLLTVISVFVLLIYMGYFRRVLDG